METHPVNADLILTAINTGSDDLDLVFSILYSEVKAHSKRQHLGKARPRGEKRKLGCMNFIP